MRYILFVACAYAAQVFACPTLSGSYNCQFPNGNQAVMTVGQDAKSGYTVYNFGKEVVIVDNQSHPLAENESFKNGTYRAWCEGDAVLKTEIIGDLFEDGSYYGGLNSQMTFQREGDVLTAITQGAIHRPSGDQSINEKTLCTLTAP